SDLQNPVGFVPGAGGGEMDSVAGAHLPPIGLGGGEVGERDGGIAAEADDQASAIDFGAKQLPKPVAERDRIGEIGAKILDISLRILGAPGADIDDLVAARRSDRDGSDVESAPLL